MQPSSKIFRCMPEVAAILLVAIVVRTRDLLYLIDSRPFRAQHRVEMFHSSDEMDSGVSRPVSKMVVDASLITEPSTARLALCSGLSKRVRLLFLLVGTR